MVYYETSMRNEAKEQSDHPAIGMLCWEKGKVPRGLEQLVELPGNSTNPKTFSFPVRYERIQGANSRTIVEEPNAVVLDAMIKAAQKMEQDGIRAITTSCGYNALLQKELADSVSIPVFTSSLLQVPMVYLMLNQKQTIGVMTARKYSFLTPKHLSAVGISESIPLSFINLEETSEEWFKIFANSERPVDLEKIRHEIIESAKMLVQKNPNIGAIILECTDLPPFAKSIQRATNLAVFDIVTLTNMVYESIIRKNFG